MNTTPKIRAKYGEGIGVELFLSFPDIKDDEKSFMDDNAVAGAFTLTASGVNFAIGQYILVGQQGNEKTEIVQISNSVAPTATLITLQTALIFPHNRGDIIKFIPYNQIEAQYSTDGITYNVITPVNIRPDASETYMQRTADLSTYSYKFRFYNSTSTLYSAYSNVALALGYADNTVWSVKNRALKQMGESISELITDSFLNESITEARRVMDQDPQVLRWSFRTKFDVVVGQMLAGQKTIATPSDLRDRNTYKNILSIRIGNQNRPVSYQDRVRFNMNYLNIVHAKTSGVTLNGATSMVLTSTHDLDTAGAITIANNAVGDGLIIVSYTGNNKNTNTLTGVTGVTRQISDATDIWQRATFGLPTAYTVDGATISFDVVLKVDYDGQDIKMDYYQAIPTITSDTDTFDEPFYDHYVSYLKYKIKYLKANGKIDRDTDSDWIEWRDGVEKVIRQDTTGQRINFIPDTEGFLSATE